jgi:hypothetical protein
MKKKKVDISNLEYLKKNLTLFVFVLCKYKHGIVEECESEFDIDEFQATYGVFHPSLEVLIMKMF